MTILQPGSDKSEPFGHAAPIYRAKGWVGTIPLRPKEKRPWVARFHGGNNPYPDDAKIAQWCNSFSNGNIGLRLGEVQINGELYEVVGLDIDHYESNGKAKRGGDLLAELENKLGKLPDSPISSARCDGISGIRFFLVPVGLHWYDAGPDFQVIWKGNRYAAAWPSIHPDLLTMYVWYLTGCKPDGNGNGDVPDAATLPFLPESWIEYLTDGNKPYTPDQIDDSSDKEIIEWAKSQFNDGSAETMCSTIRFAQNKWVTSILEEAESYPNIKGGYWEIPHLAAEGHTGWNAAIEKVGETYFSEAAEERNKRPAGAVYGESRRALFGTLKKIKPKIESGELVTARDSSGECPCCYPGPEIMERWNRNMTKQPNSNWVNQQNNVNGGWAGKIKCPSPAFPSSVAEWVVNRARNADTPIHFWQGQFWTWTGMHWVPGSSNELKAALITTLKNVYYPDKDDPDKPVWWNPKTSTVGDVFSMLKGVAFLDTEIQAQSWLDGREDQMIACRNGLVRIGDRKKFDHSPQYLNTFSLPFDYDPRARSRELAKFLKSTLPDDKEAQRALRMWFGYFISGMTDQQKMLMLVGLPRSGKGTIAAMIKALLGNGSHAPVTATELNGPFGLQPLVGKTLGIFADARVNVTGRLFIERLLSITGEDDQNVNIKGLPQMVIKLLLRFLFLSNEPPIINDPSGAIVNRMITLNLPGDFSEKPDLGLQKRLLNPTEMSGVLNWALDGLDDLLERGNLGFIQPESGKGILTIAGQGASPIKSFVNEKYILDKAGIVLKSDVFQAWKTWCEIHGYEPGKEGIARNDVHFARDLYAAFNKKIVGDRLTVDGRPLQYFRGLRPVPPGAAALRVVATG